MHASPVIEEGVRERRADGRRKLLSFVVNEELLAVDIMRVKEILEYAQVTPVPRMPPFLMGAIDLRGRVVPVVDLGLRLDRPATRIGTRSCIIIIEAVVGGAALDVGIAVDAVSRVADVEQAAIESAPSLGKQLPTEFIEGMARDGDRFLIVLDMDRVFTLRDRGVLETATRSAA